MKFLAYLLADKLTTKRDLLKPDERYRVGMIVSWSSIAGNLLLSLLKLVFGLLTNSIALMADAVHSASDIFSSLVILIGFKLARKEADQEHPHGHGRTEYLAGFLLALFLIGAGILFAYSSYSRLISGTYATPSIASIIAIIIAIITKEFLYYFSARLGKLIRSETIAGDAWHHRTDSFSSIMVFIAMTGGYLGYPTLDAYFGFAVSVLIIYAGLKIARNSSSSLIGTAPSDELHSGIVSCAKEIDGVIDTHDLEYHDYGSWKVVTLHIEVDGSLSLEEAHQIANRVEDHISNCYYCDTVVHLDPR
ncbi:MAG: cation diffusion facilitator family transporter [Bacillota bacterium]